MTTIDGVNPGNSSDHAFTEFFHDFRDFVESVCRTLLHRHEDVDELTQDTFCRFAVYSEKHDLKEMSNESKERLLRTFVRRAWCDTIRRQRGRSKLKKRPTIAPFSILPESRGKESESSWPVDFESSDDSQEDIDEWIDGLAHEADPNVTRATMLERLGCTRSEIAVTMNIEVEEVVALVERGREFIAARWRRSTNYRDRGSSSS